jgi:hypothetical protein
VVLITVAGQPGSSLLSTSMRGGRLERRGDVAKEERVGDGKGGKRKKR